MQTIWPWSLQIESLKSKLELVMGRIDRWIDRSINVSWLTLTSEKKEVIVFHRGHRIVNGVSFRHGQVAITPSRAISIWLDDNLNFGEHVKKTMERAEISLVAIWRLMSNEGGPLCVAYPSRWKSESVLWECSLSTEKVARVGTGRRKLDADDRVVEKARAGEVVVSDRCSNLDGKGHPERGEKSGKEVWPYLLFCYSVLNGTWLLKRVS